jgi:exosortase
VIQALGFPAFSEGNVISLEHGRIAVVEACSGLSMLLTFAAITTGMAMIVHRPLLDKLVIVASTVPVALAVNIARIVANGVAIEVWDAETANRVFHDLGGWLMMPLAVAAVWFELWVLSRLLIEVPESKAVPLFGLPGQPPARPGGPRPAHP